jgi:O-antigen/teichoic acid export membrane protein
MGSMNPLVRFVKNFVAMLLFRGGDVIYAFLVMALLARYFGPSLYGDYVFIISFVLIFNPIINFGMTSIMVRELAVRKASGDDYFGSGLAFRLMMAAIAMLIILASLPYLGLNRVQQLALLIFTLSELSWTAFAIFGEVFISFERMEIGTYLFAINRGISLTLLVGIIYFDLGFLAVFIGFGIINLLSMLVSMSIVRDNFLRPKLVWRADLFRFWFKAAWPMAISTAIMQYFLRVDVYILRIFRDPAEIAYFEAPYKIIAHTYLISAALAIAFSPTFAHLAQNRLAQFRPILEQSLKILLIIVIPLSAGAIIFGPNLMVPLLGEKFAPAEPAMRLLSWCILFAFYEPLLSAVLISIKRTGVVLVIHAVTLLVDLLLDLYLVPGYGYIGGCYANIAAYGTLFLVSLILTYYFVGGFSLIQVTGRVVPTGLLLGGGLYWSSYLASWKGLPPKISMAVGIFLVLVLYPILLILSRAITWQDLALLQESMDNQ